MNLARLIYCSRFSPGLDAKQLQDILDISREKNPRLGLTGILCYGPGVFLQCLEGPRTALNELYRKIVQDTRNREVTLMAYHDLTERVFGAWSMAYVRAADLVSGETGMVSGEGPFRPFSMNAEQAAAFVEALARQKNRFH